MTYLVHIGYAKCGSSFLQSTVFNGSHPQIGTLDGPGGARKTGTRKSGTGLFFDTAMPPASRHNGYTPFAYDLGHARELLQSYETQDKPVTVLSNEDWAGHPISGGTHAGIVASRIKALLPDAKILIVIREQRALLLSAYAHFLTVFSGRVGLPAYLAPRSTGQMPAHSPHFYQFSHLIRHYRDSFGAENVHVTLLEDLIRNQRETLGSICAFAGVAPPASLPPARENRRDYRHYAMLRDMPGLNALGRSHIANGYSSGKFGNLSRQVAGFSRLYPSSRVEKILARDRATIEAHLSDYLREDNRRLSEMLEIDLGAKGYLI